MQKYIIGILVALLPCTLWADSVEKTAEQLLDPSPIKGGVILHLGCGDGKLTAALAADEGTLVLGLDADPDNIARAQHTVDKRKPAGRVLLKPWRHDFLPYTDNLINVVVAEEPGSIDQAEILRVLAPLGVAHIKQNDGWTKLEKPWPAEIDEWTHWMHGPDGNPVSGDTTSGPLRGVQWMGTPRWSKSHDLNISMTGMVTAQGRLFYLADDGPVGIWQEGGTLEDWELFARDAFNGRLIWKKPVSDWGMRAWDPKGGAFAFGPWAFNPRSIHRRLVAVGDKVFVTLGFNAPISVLDAATGNVIRALSGTEFTSEIVVDDGMVYAVVDRAAQEAGQYTRSPKLQIVAVDYATDETLWTAGGFRGVPDRRSRNVDFAVTRSHLTVGGSKVYIMESDEIVALDAKTGQETWRKPRPKKVSLRNESDWHPLNNAWDLGSMLYSDGTLFFWQGHHSPWRTSKYAMDLQAMDSESGEVLWSRKCGSATFLGNLPFLYKAGGLLWAEEADGSMLDPTYTGEHMLLGIDPKTGETVKKHNVSQVFRTSHHHRCYPNKATQNHLIYGRNGIEYVNLNDGTLDINRWARGICQYGVMPANGMLYSPADPCACHPSSRYNGYYAYTNASVSTPHPVADKDRVTHGAAYGVDVSSSGTTTDAWPVYRHDTRRSGATAAKVPAQLRERWTIDFSEPITAPTMADGRVFVAAKQSCRLWALDANTGKRVWSFNTGNIVDTPPTLCDGKAYFGTNDGMVYCLRAEDGALIWSFNANPAYRQIGCLDNIESAWPVHGTVIVEDGMVYFSAGRSTYLDGGIYFYALDAATGQCIKSIGSSTFGQEDADIDGQVSGTADDLMVYDNNKVYMKNIVIDTESFELDQVHWTTTCSTSLFPPGPLSAIGGLLDDSLFDRVGWVLDRHLIAKALVYNDEYAFYMGWFKEQNNTWHRLSFKVGKHNYAIHAAARQNKVTHDFSDNTVVATEPWSTEIPIRLAAMTLTADMLFCAGTPYSTDGAELMAAIAGKRGGVLWAVDPVNGKQVSEVTLDAPPVWDGMAAISGNLFVALSNGSLACFGG